MASATLAVNFIGHTEKLRGALRDAEGQVDSFGNKLKSFGTKATDLGKKMSTFVTLPVLAAGAASFKMAGDFNESFSKMNTVFGTSGKEIDAWSKNAATSMGLSRKEAIDATGTFGNMFTQLGIGQAPAAAMSQSMVQLAADLGSFHNADITAVIDAQSSAFRGEYDALQKYIPTINAATVEQRALEMTGKATTKELTAQEKALAVQKLMMEGAGAATGDFARTSDGAANKQRILTAEFKDAATEMGVNLMPAGQKVIGMLSGLTEKFGGLSSGAQTAILVVVGLTAAIGPLIGMIGALSTAMAFLAANPVVAAILAFAAMAAATYALYQKSEDFRASIDYMGRTIVGTFQGMWRVVEPIINAFKAALDRLSGPLGSVLGAAGKLGGAVGGIVSRIPGFQTGGVVPGPSGSPCLAVVHGGERILPVSRAGQGVGSVNHYSIVVTAIDPASAQEAVVTAIREYERRNGQGWRT
jgi:hypothetical protein